MDSEKLLVSRRALADLLLWCEDAIDLRDETDAWIVPAFDELRQTMSPQPIKPAIIDER